MVAVDDTGRARVAWLQDGGVRIGLRPATAAVFGTPIVVDAGTADADLLLAVSPGGYTILSWTAGGNAKSAWQGSGALLFPSAMAGVRVQALAVSSQGDALAAWANSNREIFVSRFDGASWLTPTPAAVNFSGDAQEPVVRFDEVGNALLAWSEADGRCPAPPCSPMPSYQVRVARYSGSTHTWGPAATLTSGTSNHWSPALAVGRDGSAALLSFPVIRVFQFR